jgi:L-malate glycosyltransferase
MNDAPAKFSRIQRVLIVGPSLRFLGGQAVQAQRLLQGLRVTDAVHAEYLVVDPILPMPFGLLQRIPIVRTLATSFVYVIQLLMRLRSCDTVHVFSAAYFSFLIAPTPAIILGRLFGKRVLLNYHSGEADDHLTRWGWHAIPILRLATSVVVPTDFLVAVFGKHGIRATAIPNHLDVTQMVLRDRREIAPVFFSNRNFEAHYNIGAILQAFSIVQRTFAASSLTIAGNGSLRTALEAEAAELGVRNVTFTGAVRPEDMPNFYDQADVYVNASLIDNMPLSLLEAYASGLPVVTSDAGGIPWIARDGETARVVPAGDTSALANGMLDVIHNPGPARLRAETARAFVVNRFSWESVRALWLRAYDER